MTMSKQERDEWARNVVVPWYSENVYYEHDMFDNIPKSVIWKAAKQYTYKEWYWTYPTDSMIPVNAHCAKMIFDKIMECRLAHIRRRGGRLVCFHFYWRDFYHEERAYAVWDV